MNKAKIAVLVSGGGTNLQALIDAQNNVLNSGSIELVISNKENVYALERAKNNNISSVVILKKHFPSQEQYENEMIKVLESSGIDLIILAGFMSILSENFTSHFKNRIINVHPALIPSFCGKGYYGLKVHEAALEYGVKVTGATVHFVNEIPDGGQIILQKAVSVHENDTPESLQRRVMEEAEWIILPEAAEYVCKNIIEDKR